MLTPKELRIGNYLDYPMFRYQKIRDGGDIDNACKGDCAMPIELTEEILLKCGFVKDRSGYHLENIMSLSIAITKDNEYLFCWLDHSLNIIYKYLHQLQNLYFALTGEELNVQL